MSHFSFQSNASLWTSGQLIIQHHGMFGPTLMKYCFNIFGKIDTVFVGEAAVLSLILPVAARNSQQDC